MEALTRLVADSLARHGFDRPVDPRRLQWSRWFRCDSTHSLLVVPSKPGIFALAEDIMDLGTSNSPVGTAVLGCRAEQSSTAQTCGDSRPRLSDRAQLGRAATAPGESKRMLAVLQFSEDDDMAFTLDRMFTCANPMRARLASGRCFLRFVVIEDQTQRRNICAALNQWMLSSAEKASGFGMDFQSSLELAPVNLGVARAPSPAFADRARIQAEVHTQKAMQEAATPAPNMDSGANKNLHCPHPLPSGF